MMKQATENTDSSIRILKTATCPSLSGKSKLTYEVGYDDKEESSSRSPRTARRVPSTRTGSR